MEDHTSLKFKLALCNEDEVDGYHLFKWERPSTEDQDEQSYQQKILEQWHTLNEEEKSNYKKKEHELYLEAIEEKKNNSIKSPSKQKSVGTNSKVNSANKKVPVVLEEHNEKKEINENKENNENQENTKHNENNENNQNNLKNNEINQNNERNEQAVVQKQVIEQEGSTQVPEESNQLPPDEDKKILISQPQQAPQDQFIIVNKEDGDEQPIETKEITTVQEPSKVIESVVEQATEQVSVDQSELPQQVQEDNAQTVEPSEQHDQV